MDGLNYLPDCAIPVGPTVTEIAATILSGQAHLVGGMFDSAGNGPTLTARTRDRVKAAILLAEELLRQVAEDTADAGRVQERLKQLALGPQEDCE